jgi:DNA-binding CsgD family transcriptional regulator
MRSDRSGRTVRCMELARILAAQREVTREQDSSGRTHSAASRWKLPLSPRETEYALLYAEGATLKSIALACRVSLANVSNTIYRAKVKYRNAGYDVHTKSDVRERLVKDGQLELAVDNGPNE